MTRRGPQFGRIPYDLVAGGHCRHLDRNELAFVLVVAAHTNSRSGAAAVSPETIAREAGMYVRTAQRVQIRLVEKGILRIRVGGGVKPDGTGRTNEYELIADRVTNDDTVSVDQNPASHGDTLSADSIPVTQDDTVSSDSNPVKSRVKPRQNRP